MSNLRWILLFSGFAILFLLYFSGRPRKNNTHQSHSPENFPEPDLATAGNGVATSHEGPVHDAHGQMTATQSMTHEAEAYSRQDYGAGTYQEPQNYQQDSYGQEGYLPDSFSQESLSQFPAEQYPDAPMTSPQTAQAQATDQINQYDFDSGSATDYYEPVEHGQLQSHIARPSSSHHGVPPIPPSAPAEGFNVTDGFGPIDPADLDRPAASGEDFISSRDELQSEGDSVVEQGKVFANPISQKIAAFSDKLSLRRSNKVAQKTAGKSPEKSADSNLDKIVLLHVMAPNNGVIDGSLLLEVIESRGYHYGDLDIFHSLHEGKTVFSIAKVVEPGRFDINDIASFDTPGLALILRLPGPVQGDVAFEVMMSEAHELASALGCRVLDSGRSTLSRQTVSHLRESILEYMHREKYLSKAIS